MEIFKKYKKIIVLTLIIVLGLLFYFNQNNNQAVTDFVVSYKKFDEAIIYFTVPVYIPDNFGKNQNLLEFDNIFSQIEGTFNESASANDRLELAKRALLLNMKEIDNLNQTSILEAEADNALIELNRKATAIKNDDIRNIAVEISSFAKQELNNIISYRNIMQEKRKYTNDFLQKIIDDSGKLNKLLNFVKQEDNQQNLNETMGQLSKEFDSIKRDRKSVV